MDKILSIAVQHLQDTLSHMSFNSPVDAKIAEKQLALSTELEYLNRIFTELDIAQLIVNSSEQQLKSLANFVDKGWRFFTDQTKENIVKSLFYRSCKIENAEIKAYVSAIMLELYNSGLSEESMRSIVGSILS